jgi:RHS repeat-associated protein
MTCPETETFPIFTWMKTRFQNSTGTSSGNNRLSFMRNAGTTAIVKETNYYPFGLTHKGYNNLTTSLGSAGAKKYQYNGKELQEDYGLDWYDYGARFYDAGLGRWTSIDPLAENSISMTPYHFVTNNPLIFVDPNGMDWFYYKAKGDKDAQFHWHDGNTYNHTYSYKNEDGKEVTKTITLQGNSAAVYFQGYWDESLGKDGTLSGKGAIAAKVTVYGPNGKNDIKTYRGLTITSDKSKYPMLANGEYKAFYQDMPTSIYGSNGSISALTYRLQMPNGSAKLSPNGLWKGYGFNVHYLQNGGNYILGGFIHRTNWNGFAKYSSHGCLLIDGRQYKQFEKQLGKASNIKIVVYRTLSPMGYKSYLDAKTRIQ